MARAGEEIAMSGLSEVKWSFETATASAGTQSDECRAQPGHWH
jgi:hypothetical protein